MRRKRGGEVDREGGWRGGGGERGEEEKGSEEASERKGTRMLQSAMTTNVKKGE